MKRKLHLLLMIILLGHVNDSFSQETVFALLKSDRKRADEYFREKNFERALKYYSSVSERKKIGPSLFLQIAESSFFLKKYDQAVRGYEEYLKTNSKLPENSLFHLAESYLSLGDHKKALESYRKYVNDYGDDPIVLKKIWRLNNIQFLFEDSSHFAVRPLAVNSTAGDLFGKSYDKGLMFLSNRKETKAVQTLDASTNKPFHGLYHSPIIPDSTISGALKVGKPSRFQKTNFKFHLGSFAFYNRQSMMVLTKLGKVSGLVFAEQVGNSWITKSQFPFNSTSYSIHDPAINEEGTVLYFSSDMPGGYGGKDLYRSILRDGTWSKPVNLGETINTKYDEMSPFVFNNTTLYFSSDMPGGFGGRDLYRSILSDGTWSKPVNLGETINTKYDEMSPFVYNNTTLYFSSNGQPGMGGLDIFKSEILIDDFEEPKNIGYPVNSKLDDFGVWVDSTGRRGFFTSNRKAGEFDDDLYEFEMDLQTYPLVINGTLRFREHNWNDSSTLQRFARAKMIVVDVVRDVVVFEQITDQTGKFTITIPYFSVYKIRVVGEDQHENVVSLDLAKHRTEVNEHDIVVVKDAFRNPVVSPKKDEADHK